MKPLRRYALLVALLLCAAVNIAARADAPQRQRRSPAQIRSAVSRLVGAERAARLQPVDEREVLAVLSDSAAGFAVVGYNPDFPAVLAFGDAPIDMDNPSPEFLYLMDLYERALETSPEEAENVRAKAPARASSINANISPLVKTTWAQGSPYNQNVPYDNSAGKRSLAGCVAVAYAQVFKFYECPRKMHGYKRYTYTNDAGTRLFFDYDFGAVTFDWANMPNALKDNGAFGIGNTSAAQNNAVSELMHAAGVMASMMYTSDNSAAYSDIAAASADDICDDLSFLCTGYEDALVMDELRAGRPVIYSGASSKSEGHCFVIDGCNANGYLHCNLGWGGNGDGYYLPSDMKGYCFYQEITLVEPVDNKPVNHTPLGELHGRTARAERTSASAIDPSRWYALWNAGRNGSPSSAGVRSKLQNVSTIPSGETTSRCGGQLVRFIPTGDDGLYYIQTGLGDYWNTFYTGGTYATSADPQQKFVVEQSQPGYFCIRSGNVNVFSNGIGSDIIGMGSSAPSNVYNGASWTLHPVSLGYDPAVPPSFDSDLTYVLKNVGYSQGYLVAVDGEDHPTLRGVTKDHSNGLHSTAYHDAPDFYSLDSFWYIKNSGGNHYLVNAGRKQSVTNGGDRTVYTFSDEAKPINITLGSDGLFRLNSGTHAESYLCAATHLPNPVAFWTSDDDGSKWTIEPMEPYAHVEQLTADNSSVDVYETSMVLLHVNVLPAKAHNKQVAWTSLNPSIATVNDDGLVTALAVGTATIRATSADVPSVTFDFEVNVSPQQRITSLAALNDGAIYTLRNTGSNGYSMGYLVAMSPSDSRPTLRGVTKVHSQGCKNEAYKSAPDFSNPGTYWQILTDGYVLYLYNCGTQKFLTNGGSETPYFLTPESVPINVSCPDGFFRFNGTDNANSYLCAATHSDLPAAYWTADDQGSVWTIAEVEDAPVAPTTFYAFKGGSSGHGATVKTLVDAIHNLPRFPNKAIIDLIVRGILNRKE